MSKYQEKLNKMRKKRRYGMEKFAIDISEALQELVDKDTPLTVQIENDYELYEVKDFFKCPSCNNLLPLLHETKYCYVCGQRINTEEETDE
jgi:hypothetical protein